MSEKIILEDGRFWHTWSSLVRDAIRDTAREIGDENEPLRRVLREYTKAPPFLFDVRALNPKDRKLFMEKLKSVAKREAERLRAGPEQEWQVNRGKSFRQLYRMIRSIEKGEPPDALNDGDEPHPCDPMRISGYPPPEYDEE